MRGSNKIEMTGKRFGRYLVIGEDSKDNSGRVRWVCSCDCGTEKSVLGQSLRSGAVVSCGCHKNEILTRRTTKHGMFQSPEYATWQAMKKRCNLPSNVYFANYGGRGINVCERWKNSFENFYADMGPKPTKKHSIERLDVNQGYFKENCSWILLRDQAKNTRRTSYVFYEGKTVPLWTVYEKENPPISYRAFRNRIYVSGWSLEAALAEPKRPGIKLGGRNVA